MSEWYDISVSMSVCERKREIILNNLAFSSRAICLCTLKDVILMAFIDYLSNNALYKQIFLYIIQIENSENPQKI